MPSRRSFIRSSMAALMAAGAARRAALAQSGPDFEVAEKGIRELQEAMTSGEVTSERLVELYLRRIANFDQSGPRLNAVIHVNPSASIDARRLDEERQRRGPRGPLHGIPVLVKDNFETRDMPTTGGSLALLGIVPQQDAFQVRQLRLAGAVLIGKVNLHELALGLTSASSLGGQTLNPYDPRRAPGGSSGGSGAAAAACFAAFTMGTDTSGSIRIPSSHNCLVGIRPSAGLSSRAGIIPFGHTQDTGGPMARTVEDVALALDATVGYDPDDPTTTASGGRIPRSFTTALTRGSLKGARIGVLAEYFGTAPEDAEVAGVVRGAVERMQTLGAAAVDVVVPELPKLVAASNLLTQELKAYLNGYLERAGAHAVSIEQMLEAGLHASAIQGILDVANGTADDYLQGGEYQARLAARETLARAVVEAMDALKVDALVYPTIRRIAPLVGGAQQGSNAALSANSGLPAVTVPAGFTPGGFPVGIELLGRRFDEGRLLGLAYDYEQATRHRRLPASTPPIGESGSIVSGVVPGGEPRDVVHVEVTARGPEAAGAPEVPFQATALFGFSPSARTLGYTIRLRGERGEIAGVFLHRRAARRNGGVAHVLSRTGAETISGTITLTEPETADLKAGKLYVSVISSRNPRVSARADLPPV